MSEQVMNIPLLQALNKNYEDAQQLSGNNAAMFVEKTWENLDTFNRNLLNYNHLSRNFVIYRENGSTPALGFYQHDGADNGWLSRNIEGPTYQHGVWYRMKMIIESEKTHVKCWEEASGETSGWTTFNTPQAQRLPVIQPIPLPNDKDPFELTVAPKVAPTQTQTGPPETPQQKIQNSNAGTGTWSIKKSETTQPETTRWSTSKNISTAPKMNAWKVEQPTSTTPIVKGWNISGKEQETKNEKIAQSAGSIGIIAAGAAVEYQIISPVTHLQIMPARKKIDTNVNQSFTQENVTLIEKDREREWLLKHGTQEPVVQQSTSPSVAQATTPQEPAQQKQPTDSTTPRPAEQVRNTEQKSEKPTVDRQIQKPVAPAAPAQPAHSTFWYLQHGQSPIANVAQKNINEKISKAGEFATLGGPN